MPLDAHCEMRTGGSIAIGSKPIVLRRYGHALGPVQLLALSRLNSHLSGLSGSDKFPQTTESQPAHIAARRGLGLVLREARLSKPTTDVAGDGHL